METLRFLMATTFYPPYHLGGDAVHVQYLAEALAARGHEVHVEFSPAAYRLKRKALPASGPNGGQVRVHPLSGPLGRAHPIAAHVRGRSRSVSRSHETLLRDIRPDVVHLHNISLLGLGVLERPKDALMVYTAHDYWARCPRSDLLKYGTHPCVAPSCVACSLVSHRPPQLWRYGTRWRGLPAVDVAIAPGRVRPGGRGMGLARASLRTVPPREGARDPFRVARERTPRRRRGARLGDAPPHRPAGRPRGASVRGDGGTIRGTDGRRPRAGGGGVRGGRLAEPAPPGCPGGVRGEPPARGVLGQVHGSPPRSRRRPAHRPSRDRCRRGKPSPPPDRPELRRFAMNVA